MSTGERLRLLAITDEPVLAFGVECLLAQSPFRVAIARDLDEAEADLGRERADVILADEKSCGTIEAARRLKRHGAESRIALWGRVFSNHSVSYARQSGIEAFVPLTATPGDFLEELNRLAATGATTPAPAPEATVIRLAARESELIGLLTEGMSNAEIAAAMGVSVGTVKSYVVRILRKTGARDRFELAILGLKNAWSGQANWEGPNAFVSAQDDERSRPVLTKLLVRRANGCD